MNRIDAHQHFWQYNPVRDTWIDDRMDVLKQDFHPQDLRPMLEAHGFDGSVAIQADQSICETIFLLDLADQHTFIKGVVGWIDLVAKDVAIQLEIISAREKLVGLRHIAQAEPPGFYDLPDFRAGLGHLAHYHLRFDLLIYADQLAAAIRLVEDFPNQQFVLDHMAKPRVDRLPDKTWSDQIKELASSPNVCCKISGMLTEVPDFQWKNVNIEPYLDTVLEAFGPDRVLYGSDWPVCLLAATYAEQLFTIEEYIKKLSKNEQKLIMGLNASRVYRLKV